MLRKPFAIAVSASILLTQAATMFGHTGAWYWPFMDYPMYSEAKRPGDAVRTFQLRLAPCGPASTAWTATPHDLGIRYFLLQGMLSEASAIKHWRLAEPRPDSMAAALDALVVGKFGGRYCGASIWVQELVLGRHVPASADAPWREVRRWTVGMPLAGLPSTPGAP